MAGTDTAQERRMLNRSLAQMLKGGVIMDVTTPEQAQHRRGRPAPCAVMALERIPADIRAAGGVSRMSDPDHDQGHPARPCPSPSWPSAASGTSSEAQILQAIEHRLHRRVRGALPRRRRLPHRQDGASPCPSCAARATWARRCAASHEGAAMIRTKGEPGTGDVVQAVRHMRMITREIRARGRPAPRTSCTRRPSELQVPYELLSPRCTRRARCPWCNFAAGGVATPADAALMMQLGAEGVFVGSRHLQVAATPPSAPPPSCRP